jgi:hypothetical protein
METVVLPTPPDARSATVIRAAFALFLAESAWPRFVDLDCLLDRQGESDREKVLMNLPAGLVYGIGPGSLPIADDDVVALSVAAMATCDDASDLLDLFLAVVAHAAALEAERDVGEAKPTLSATDVHRLVARVPAAIRPDLVARIGEILKVENWGWSGRSEGPPWSFTFGRRVRPFRGISSLADYWELAHPHDGEAMQPQQTIGTAGTPEASWIEAPPQSIPGSHAESDQRVLAGSSFDDLRLHPWVARAAASLWETGHRRQAVEEAARSIETHLRARLNVDGGTGARLVTDAFTTSDPRPGRPRLRFRQVAPRSESWTNAHEGAMSFGRGCMMRVRNMYTHGHEPAEHEPQEALAALSLLARWIDDAEVEVASS